MDGISRIDKVVALWDTWLAADLFPFPKMKVKVLETSRGEYLALGNLHRKNPVSGYPEYTSGLGDTIENATNDFLTRFVKEVRADSESRKLGEADFEWSAPEDF